MLKKIRSLAKLSISWNIRKLFFLMIYIHSLGKYKSRYIVFKGIRTMYREIYYENSLISKK